MIKIQLKYSAKLRQYQTTTTLLKSNCGPDGGLINYQFLMFILFNIF